MKKLIGLAMVAVAGSALIGAANAADTSSTIVTRETIPPIGITPRFAYLEVSATAAAASAGSFTFDIPVNEGRTFLGVVPQFTDTSGNHKSLRYTLQSTVTNTQITVLPSGQASATAIVSGDTARVLVIYR